MSSKSLLIENYENFSWVKKETEIITYNGVINFPRATKKEARHCVMCGLLEDGETCIIPNQNKDVCRKCDSSYWLLKEFDVVIKFCKGCKTFFALMHYDEKPEASKCGTCRRRGRDNYHNKKRRRIGNDNISTPQEFCSVVNTMTRQDDEVIDVQTLLEFVSGYDVDDRGLQNFNEGDPMSLESSSFDSGDMSISHNGDDDKDFTDLFTSSWLPELTN